MSGISLPNPTGITTNMNMNLNIKGMTSSFGGQSLSDRVNAARYALSGQGLARTVCKATTEEMLAPKKKHLDCELLYDTVTFITVVFITTDLIQCTSESNVSMPSLGNLVMERALNPSSSWVVVLKSLTTMHHLMCFGHERFSAYLASAPDVALTQLARCYVDRTATPGGTEMAPFCRRYAAYVLARITSYRLQGYDFAKVKRAAATPAPVHPQASSSTTSSAAKTAVVLRELPFDEVLVVLPRIQTQVDALLDFGAKESDLKNAVIRASFLLLFRDLVRLFASFNDCIISLLESFFTVKEVKTARVALDLYIQFTERMDRVAEFLKTAEAVGVDRGDIPDLARAPYSLLNHLEGHCLVLEGKDPTEVLNRPPPVKAVAPPAVPAPPPTAAAFNPFLAATTTTETGVAPTSPFFAPNTAAAAAPPPIPPQPQSVISNNPFPTAVAPPAPVIPPQPVINPFPAAVAPPAANPAANEQQQQPADAAAPASFNPFM